MPRLIDPIAARLAQLELEQEAETLDPTALISKLYDGLTATQREVWDSNSRFRLLIAGRRYGKTYLCITRLIVWALERPGSLCYYCTQSYVSAKQIAWRQLKTMLPPAYMVKTNETELSVELVNGSRIQLKGLERPDSLRGTSLSAVVVDEAAYVRQEAWEMVLRPALSDQCGPAWFISTPAGLNWLHELWEQAQDLDDWSTHSYTTIEGGNVPPEEVEAARRTLDSRTFLQEFEASFQSLAGRVYPDFSDDNISEDVKDTGGAIMWGSDFNVGTMAGVLGSRVGDTLHIWDEVSVKQSNTDEVCAMLRERFKDRKLVAYPDPTGSARRTSSAGRTDHEIIRQYGFGCVSPKAPWAVKDKINATNSMIRNASGQIRLFVHPRCKDTIKALRNVTYKPNTEDYIIDKSANIEHWSDALGYLILSEFNPLYERAGKGTGIRLY